MKGQSKLHSFIEQLCNIGSGYIIAVLMWAYIVTPWLGIENNISQNLGITTMFTVVSLIRDYLWRRLWDFIHRNADQ